MVPKGTQIVQISETEEFEEAWLNPLHLLVIRDSNGNPHWLVAALTVDSSDLVALATTKLDSAKYTGLYRLPLDTAGAPVKGASWEQISGLGMPYSFRYAWRFVTGLAATHDGGLVASTLGWKNPGFGCLTNTWVEGGVFYCPSVSAPEPDFRLVLVHPAARSVATVSGRLFVALSPYERINDTKGTAQVMELWQDAGDTGRLATCPTTTMPIDKRYFNELENGLTTLKAPVGIFEVRGGSSPFSAVAGALPGAAELAANAGDLVCSMVPKALTLHDLTGNLVERNMMAMVRLQVINGSRRLGRHVPNMGDGAAGLIRTAGTRNHRRGALRRRGFGSRGRTAAQAASFRTAGR